MLRETLTYADAIQDGDQLDLSVAQLPHYPDDDWVGIDGVRPTTSGRVSLVARADDGMTDLVTDPPEGDPVVAGLLVDEWVERVPSEEEHTAVSFRYDDPNNQPPQAILLATPPRTPESKPSWTVSDLAATIEETMEMTRYRAVDLASLQPDDSDGQVALGHLLPGLFFAQDTHVQPNEPTLDFTPLDLYGEWLSNHDRAMLGFGAVSNSVLSPEILDRATTFSTNLDWETTDTEAGNNTGEGETTGAGADTSGGDSR
jgi:hypothetical protein